MSNISFGIKEFDQYFKKALRPGMTILIAGYPGAGKTTLAATIGYRNCAKGGKVLYISFFEHADRFKLQMRSLGLNFDKYEEKGLFKYIKVPLIPSQEAIDDFMRQLMEFTVKFQPKIIIIDGITPLVQVMKDEAKIRSFLQTVVYDIPRLIKGMLILVADLPFGTEEVKLAGIEFTVDAVFIMKYKVITSRIIRFLEIRKIRGAPLDIAEVPYQIAEKQGIRLFFPVIPKELKPPLIEEPLHFGLPTLDDTLGPIYKGSVIVIAYPPHIRPLTHAGGLIASLIVNNKLKTVIVSYKYSDKEIKKIIESTFKKYGYLDELMKYIAGIHTLNPTAMSFQEVFFREDKIIEELNPDVVVIHGFDVIFRIVEFSGTGLDRLYSLLYNRLLRLKSEGRIVVFFIPKLGGKFVETLSSLADVTFTIDYKIEENKIKPVIIAWKKPCEPILVSPDLLYRHIEKRLSQ
ncbi:AAA family ATPase [Desulfurococcaceae archaeon MEX13E-LK6-19]|nr:AAA family ATPase [Desulfurococcaceae archaeon MEX13E-LK6-19]